MRISLFVVFISLLSFSGKSQSSQYHWETVVYDTATWRYIPGTNDPGTDWMQPGFNDDLWSIGQGGFGYGDNDELTIVDADAIFIRKTFSITDIENINSAILHIDYDDGFVAYLNGVEIARSNMAQQFPSRNDFSQTAHEALLYQGFPPQAFDITGEKLNLLQPGENTLAIQVHNSDAASSDLTIRPFFSVKVNGNYYYDPPSWFAQAITFESSNLPIFVIETNGQGISDEPEIIANLGIIDNQTSRNSVIDPFNGYNGKIAIEFRGESSQMFPKKSLKLETVTAAGADSTVSLLGLPPEDDWVLYAPYTDKTMLRDVLSYRLFNDMGRYASRARFCEVVINGEYQGVYVLLEKIKQDKNRVDIAKLTPEDLEGDDLTGGYILRVDKIDPNDYPNWESVPSPRLPDERIIFFQYFDPDGEDLAEVQKHYIQDFILNVQSALTSANFGNPSTGYEPLLDVPSFVDFMLLNEVGKNIDAYIYSTYMYKDKDSNGGKLHMGPAWDFNLAFGNVDYWANAQFAPGWMYNDDYRMFWFRRLMADDSFKNAFKCRWQELRQTILKTEYIHDWIDSTAAVLEEAQQRNYQRWPILGTYVWPNQYIGATYKDEIDFLKEWITDRLLWMDSNLSNVVCKTVTGIDDENMYASVFPNPSASGFHFKFKKPIHNGELKIYDPLGSLVFTASISGIEYFWNAKNIGEIEIAKGLYTYHISMRDGKYMSGKILKE